MKLFKYNDHAFSIYNFLSPEECSDLISAAESTGFEKALIDDGNTQSECLNVRNNQRIIFDDQTLANRMWSKIFDLIPSQEDWVPIGLNERFRYYKYDRYQTFKWHRDLPYIRNDNERSLMTFMIYLNSDYDGGYTDFEDFKIWPETGMALVFKHKLRHEGAYVTDGIKYVLRSDVMFDNQAGR